MSRHITEQQMRKALGLTSYKKAKPNTVGDSWYVKASVRKLENGVPTGPVFEIEKVYPTLSRFDAEMRLAKDVTKMGCTVWFILESEQKNR